MSAVLGTAAPPAQRARRVEERRGGLRGANRSVSPPRSSNRTCRFAASGSPTGFTAQHTELRPAASGIVCGRPAAPSPRGTAHSNGSCRHRCCQAQGQSPRRRHFHERTRSQGPSLPRHYPASPVLWPCPTPAAAAVLARRGGVRGVRDGGRLGILKRRAKAQAEWITFSRRRFTARPAPSRPPRSRARQGRVLAARNRLNRKAKQCRGSVR